jgi:hypothetical protein
MTALVTASRSGGSWRLSANVSSAGCADGHGLADVVGINFEVLIGVPFEDVFAPRYAAARRHRSRQCSSAHRPGIDGFA